MDGSLRTVRREDGFRNTTPHLRPVVEKLQQALVKAGFSMTPDGLFGDGTHAAVASFQRDHGLVDDGIVGPATWRALREFLPAPEIDHAAGVSGFESFHGDLDWVHRREGHAGKPYWPGGASGVTLDPGVDLGFQTVDVVKGWYKGILTDPEFDLLSGVLGVNGEAAKQALAADNDIRAIRISRADALKVMPHVAVNYWTAVAKRFPNLAEEETPPSVQTALLSLAYNRGAKNRGLAVLTAPIEQRDWLGVAEKIGGMQQNHSLVGIRRRRRMEADLIRDELIFI